MKTNSDRSISWHSSLFTTSAMTTFGLVRAPLGLATNKLYGEAAPIATNMVGKALIAVGTTAPISAGAGAIHRGC